MGEDPEYQVATDSETSAQRDARIAEIEAQKEENEEWGPVEAIPNIMADDKLYEVSGRAGEAATGDGEHPAAQAADRPIALEGATATNMRHAAEDRDTEDPPHGGDDTPHAKHGDSGVDREPSIDSLFHLKAARPHNDETIHSGYDSGARVDPVFAALDGALGAAPLASTEPPDSLNISAFDTTVDSEFAQGGAQDPLAPLHAHGTISADHLAMHGGVHDYSEQEIDGPSNETGAATLSDSG